MKKFFTITSSIVSASIIIPILIVLDLLTSGSAMDEHESLRHSSQE